MTSLRIVFAGTPAFGLPCLEALATSKHQLQAIYTQPDRPAGRGRKLQASAVKVWAEAHDFPVYQPINFKDPQTVEELALLAPDVIVVIAYGLILPRSVLNIPRLGCVNVHASLLPRWRGASPIQHAILHGDEQSGVTIMQMDVGMDTGDMLNRASCDILPTDTSEQLHDRLASIASEPLLKTLAQLANGQAHPEKQAEEFVTYAPKINKEDAAINWQCTAREIDQQIRAFHPWPVAYTMVGDLVIRIHQAQVVNHTSHALPGTILAMDKQGILVNTGQDALLIQRLQLPGGKAISVNDYLNAGRTQLHLNLVFQ